jgi:MFS family permease
MNVRRYQARLGFTLRPLFLSYCFANILQGLGTYLPGIYLPSYAKLMGFGDIVATTSLSLLNVGTLLGSVAGGLLTDRWSTKGIITVSALASTSSAALLWGLSKVPALLLIFGITHGFFTGCLTATWPGVIGQIVERDTTMTAEPSMIFALFVAGRGIGNVASGPLSQSLLHLPLLNRALDYGYGSTYGPMILFLAGMMAAGGLGAVVDTMGLI